MLRNETKQALHSLSEQLKRDSNVFQNTMEGWSISATELAKKYDKLADMVRRILDDAVAADEIEEAAEGFEIIGVTHHRNGDRYQTVRYRKTGREVDQVWTRATMATMDVQTFALRVEGKVPMRGAPKK